MPPRIKPATLKEMSLASVASLTIKLCLDIEGKYGSWEHPACPNAVTNAKMYLSTIQPLFDDLCKAILNLCSGVKLHLVLELLMCDKIRTVNLSRIINWNNRCLSDSVFWENQLVKLNNVVELDIKGVRLTKESFRAIGDVCTRLRRITLTSDLRYAPMNSLLHILKCRKLRDVEISFYNWTDGCQYKYTRMILTGLPKLEHFAPFEESMLCHREGEALISTPLTLMRKVCLMLATSVEIGAVIRLCPNLKDISLVSNYQDADDRHDFERGTKVLETLAESSLQLDALHLNGFAFSTEMTRLITSNCTNLAILDLDGWEGRRISVNDIYTVGMSCPKIETLRINESCCDQEARLLYIDVHSPNMEEQTFLAIPPMFVHLKTLLLYSNVDCDLRILPLVLRHANRVTDLSLRDVFKTTNISVDMVTEVLNANSLPELERLSLEGESYGDEPYRTPLSIASIERLLDSCPKLTNLDLECPMEYETIQYLLNLQRDMPINNFNISLQFQPLLFADE